MATLDFDLDKGLKVGKTAHKKCVLKEADVGILMSAAREAEVASLVDMGRYDENGRSLKEPAILINPYLMELHTLRLQVVRIGEIQGPLELPHWERLSERDIVRIKAEAETLAGIPLAPGEVALRGRVDGQGGADPEADSSTVIED